LSRVWIYAKTIGNLRYYSKIQKYGLNYCFRKPRIFAVQKQPLRGRNLGKAKIKHSKITRRFELDTGSGITESAVNVNSTADRHGPIITLFFYDLWFSRRRGVNLWSLCYGTFSLIHS